MWSSKAKRPLWSSGPTISRSRFRSSVTKAGWKFDTAAGRLEILYRRIGRNELDAIQTCLAYVDAQNEYADKDRTGAGAGVYAQRIVSSPGKKDGLYLARLGGDAKPARRTRRAGLD